jgi:hypothetical protein
MHTIFLPRNDARSFRREKITIEPAPPRIPPTPLADWPTWTRVAAKFRHPEDRGLGDTLVHLIGDARSERFKKWFRRKFDRTCGCTERRRWLNQKFPYAARE